MSLFLFTHFFIIRVKMLSCLAEAEIEGGFAMSDLEQPCVDVDMDSIWTATGGEDGSMYIYIYIYIFHNLFHDNILWPQIIVSL